MWIELGTLAFDAVLLGAVAGVWRARRRDRRRRAKDMLRDIRKKGL